MSLPKPAEISQAGVEKEVSQLEAEMAGMRGDQAHPSTLTISTFFFLCITLKPRVE